MAWRGPNRTGIARAGGIGAAAGALVALSLPPFGWWPLAWVGIGAIAAALPGMDWRRRFAVGLFEGLVQYGVGILWVQEFTVVGLVALLILCSLYSAFGVVMVPTRRWWMIAFGLPASAVVVEWVRDRFPLGGFPLGALALGQVAGPLSWTLRLGGSLLLTAETVTAGVALAWVVSAGAAMVVAERARLRAVAEATPRPLAALAVTAVAVVVPLAGWLGPSGAGGHLSPVRIALVQGGGPRGTRAVRSDPQVVFDRHLAASREVQSPVDLVIWPEGVLQSRIPFQAGSDAAAVARLARELTATVVVGVDQDVGASRYVNQVVVWSPDGRVVSSYQKNHLVPFGEYVPDRSLVERLFDVNDVPYDGIPGKSAAFLPTPAAPLGVMISYEVFFDERARSAVRAGGQLLIVPTNTASYRSTQVATQELTASRMRAIETGRWLAQASPTGYTAVIRPDGQVQTRTTLDHRAVIETEVGRDTGRTLYVDLSDLPFLLAALAALGGCLFPLAHRRAERTVSDAAPSRVGSAS